MMLFSSLKSTSAKALGKFRLADARWAQEDKGTNGLIGILDTSTSADNGFGDSLHSFILTDDPLMEDFIQVSQFLLSPSIRRLTGSPSRC